jgi:hypothetical protein
MHRTKRRHANHIKGGRGVDIVRGLLPEHWVVREVTPDYGLDLHVEVFQVAPDDPKSADTLGEHFFAQVKTVDGFDVKSVQVRSRANVTKAVPNPSEGEPVEIDVIPCVLDVAEIRTVEEMGSAVPVVLIVADRTTGEARYVCLNDWISKVLLPSNPDYDSRKSVTVHIPTWNVLDADEPSFATVWLLARRAKFYAAFAGFAYQYHELRRACDLADILVSNGARWCDAAAEEGVLEMLNVFLRGALRLGIWGPTGDGWWQPLRDVHQDLLFVHRLLQGAGRDDEKTFRVVQAALMAYRRADNLGRMYEELCREWGLPTALAAAIQKAEAAEPQRAGPQAPRSAPTSPGRVSDPK